MMRSVTIALTVLLLAGCASSQDTYQGTDYTTAPIMRMSVSAILVDSEFKPAGTLPNIEHQLQPQPEDTLRSAIMQHYVAARQGQRNSPALRFVIKDASVVENKMDQATNSFTRALSKDADYRYTGRLEIESKTEGVALRNGFVHAEATRSLDVVNAGPEERQKLIQGMVRQMVDDVMVQLDQQTNTNMEAYVLSGADINVVPQTSGRWDHVNEDRVSRSAGMRVLTSK